MKHLLFAAVLGALSATAVASDVGVSINIGQPGFYGQIDVGGFPPPPVIYRQPRVIHHVPADRAPLYLRVPPGHAKNWSKHCRAYNACNERVYFVKDNWYQNEYAPRYRQRSDYRNNDHRDDRRDDHRDNGNNQRGDNQRGDHGNNQRGDHGNNQRGDHGNKH